VDFIHAHSQAKVGLQLGHAGRKGSTKLAWEGMDEPLEEGGWEVMAASPIPYFPHSPVPKEMGRDDMECVRGQFVRAAGMAGEAGFDLLEIHFAHGYLLASFISPLTNVREDEYGGTLENRMRFPIDVLRAVRGAWPAPRPLSVRISAVDWAPGGITDDDAVEMARMIRATGADIVDVSAGQTVPHQKPKYGRQFQTPFSDRVRHEAGIHTMARPAAPTCAAWPAPTSGIRTGRATRHTSSVTGCPGRSRTRRSIATRRVSSGATDGLGTDRSG
jgi:anthraniloyl-CoA monooxygenase